MEEKLKAKKLHKEMELVRQTGRDLTLTEHLKDAYDGMTIDKYYAELGVDPTNVSVGQILDRQDESVRWLVPEIFRDAIRKGFINSPIYQDFIIREETVSQPTQVAPFWDTTGIDNSPKPLGAGEAMELGSLKYGQKTVHISKTGIGLEIVDEAIRYSSVSMMALFLQDVGIKLGSSLSKQLINVLINGDQANGSEAASTVGVATAATMVYGDLVKVFVRGSLRNRKWLKTIGNEATINFLLNMPEFRPTNLFGAPNLTLNTKTPVPKTIDAYVHNSVPNNQLIMVDPSLAAVQLTAVPLTVESERIVQRQLNGTYVSVTTGFMNVFSDARIILDRSVTTDFPAALAPLY